jgi:pyruvate kinase
MNFSFQIRLPQSSQIPAKVKITIPAMIDQKSTFRKLMVLIPACLEESPISRLLYINTTVNNNFASSSPFAIICSGNLIISIVMKNQKKTKIVATIGPSSEGKETLADLVEAGVDIIRLNFSHGDFAEHKQKIQNWREIADERNEQLGIMQDLSGPEIRTGTFTDGEVTLESGDTFVLTTEDVAGTKERVNINYDQLPQDADVGDEILLSDGKLQLTVTETSEVAIATEVIVGGTISDRRGVNLPDTNLSMPALTEKDRQDLQFAAQQDVDFVALSFVRNPRDIHDLRSAMHEHEIDAHVIAKIETQQAVDNLTGILEEVDGVMVARGFGSRDWTGACAGYTKRNH